MFLCWRAFPSKSSNLADTGSDWSNRTGYPKQPREAWGKSFEGRGLEIADSLSALAATPLTRPQQSNEKALYRFREGGNKAEITGCAQLGRSPLPQTTKV